MRNVKLLWMVIIVMTMATLIQFVVLMNIRSDTPGHEANPQPGKTDHSEDPDVPYHDPEQREDNDLAEDRLVAVVGDIKITEQAIRDLAFRKYGNELLNQKVDHLLVQMEADVLGIHITEAEIDQEIKKMQAGYDSEESFYRMMEELGMDKESLREEAAYKLASERMITRGIHISDELVDQYILNHPEEFQSFIKLRVHMIVTETRKEAEDVIKDLEKGTPFAQIAHEQSIDERSRNKGGDLGWLEEDDLSVDPRILYTAQQMQVGQMSPVIQLNQTYAVIKLVDRMEIDKETTEQIREDVRRQLALLEAPSLQDVLVSLKKKYRVQWIE